MLGIRPFCTADAKKIVTWAKEPSEFYMWSAGLMGKFPATEQKLLQAVSARISNPKYFPLVAYDKDGPVGFLTIRTPGEDDKKLALGYVIIDSNKRNMGYGKQMIKLSLKFAFEEYGASEVSLDVFDVNSQAYNCYKSVGFNETGKQEKCIIDEYTWNYIEMKIDLADYNNKK